MSDKTEPLTAKIILEELYTLEIGGKRFEGFKKVSEWNGLTKFQRGNQVVILYTGDGLTAVIRNIFSTEIEPTKIVLISPELLSDDSDAQVSQEVQ